MRIAYSEQLSPPGLILPTHFRRVGAIDALTVDGKIDTGADMTAIPLDLKNRLRLRSFTLRRCKGALDVTYSTVATCFIEYSLKDADLVEIEVLATARSNVLLGRDILNTLVLVANGPQMYFEIQKSAT